jgi:hypothetical protein
MSTMPPVKSLQGAGWETTSRVDTAHSTVPANDLRSSPNDPRADAPPLGLLKAIAGHDPHSAAQQLRGQALELATLLRDKQRLLEQRESELNARAALLESDLRAARLRRFQEDRPRAHAADDTAALSSPVSRPVTGSTGPGTGREDMTSTNFFPATESAEEGPRREDSCNHVAREPTTPARATLLAARELNEQLEHLEQQRQQLRQREEKLERRQRHVEQMHDEVTQLHREALELRLASEQVWADLKQEFPPEELSETLSAIRGKLADHFRLASDMLARRKDELHELRGDLNAQEQRLRQQRRDLQMWADRRYDEVESRLAKIILRERELDQLEGEFQRQTIQWQQQREAYRQEIEQLSWQLHERSAG